VSVVILLAISSILSLVKFPKVFVVSDLLKGFGGSLGFTSSFGERGDFFSRISVLLLLLLLILLVPYFVFLRGNLLSCIIHFSTVCGVIMFHFVVCHQAGSNLDLSVIGLIIFSATFLHTSSAHQLLIYFSKAFISLGQSLFKALAIEVLTFVLVNTFAVAHQISISLRTIKGSFH